MKIPYCTQKRPIEAELVMDRGDVGRAGAGLDQQRRRVAGDPDKKEDRQRQQKQRQQRIAERRLAIYCFMASSLSGWIFGRSLLRTKPP